MFVALRDLRSARGRFVLITLVVLMVAVLVSFLSGLTAGLRHQNVSAIEAVTAQSVVFSDDGAEPSFDESSLSADQIGTWQAAGGVVDPVGISRDKASSGGPATSVALFGADAGFGERMPTAAHTVVLSDAAANDLDAGTGDVVTVGGDRFTVSAVRGDDWFGHSPVIWLGLTDWQSLNPTGSAATVLAVSGVADMAAANKAAGTTSESVSDSLQAIGSYKSENMSLTLMTVMLFAISALVIGAFFTIWTIQRTPDIAVLKALGASTASLIRDALGQALIVLVAGVGAGLGITVIAGAVMGDAVPFVLDASTTILPAAGLIGLGLLGAGFALRFVTTTDPLTALGSTR